MTSAQPSHRRGAAPLFVALAVAAGGVRAADDRVGEAAADAQPAETVRFAPVNVQGMGLARPGDYDLGLLFDQQVFGRARGAQVIVVNNEVVMRRAVSKPDESVLDKLRDLRDRGTARIDRLEQVCGLTGTQRQALELALASDLRRVASEIDTVRRTYAGQRLARQRLAVEQERLQEMHREAVRCRGLIERAFQPGSLMAAVTTSVLEPPQQQRLADWVAGRRATRWEAMVRLVLGQLDDTVLGLSQQQHQALTKRLLADVPPLAVFDDERLGRDPTNFHGMLVLTRLGRAGEKTLRPLLDPRQWAELDRRIAQAGLRDSIERMLVEQGILEDVPAATGEEAP